MAEIDVHNASIYFYDNVIDIEDWENYDEGKRTRILNVAKNTLLQKYSNLIIPNEAIYEFAAVLAVLFNDINKNQFYGVSNYALTGVSSYSFKNTSVGNLYETYIPELSIKLIERANGIVFNKTEVRVGRTT